MAILLTCACGKRLSVAEQYEAKKVRCPACGRVLLVQQAEVYDELEVVPDPPASFDERLPAKGYPIVRLRPMSKREGERWELELAEDELRLFDDDGELAMRIPRDEANARIHFPSFWLSIKSLQFHDGSGSGRPRFEFHPDKKALQRIRAYLDNVLRDDPRARRKLKQRALAVLVLGLFAGATGCGVLVLLSVKGEFAAGRFRGVGFAIAGFLLALGLVITGISMFRRAVRMGRESTDDEED
jgi:hypothetical protein